MNIIKRKEAQKDFLLELIDSNINNPPIIQEIVNLLNIPDSEVCKIYEELDRWKVEQLEKDYGIAELILQLLQNNPKYKIANYLPTFIKTLGLSKDQYEYFLELLLNEYSNCDES